MRYEEVTVFIVNDADTYVVDSDGNDRLLWDLNDDTMAIGRNLKGESCDSYGYVDMTFEKLETFDSKRKAMEAWCA